MIVLVLTALLGVRNGSFAEDGLFLAVALTMIVGYTTIGALISSRTRQNPIGWLLMLVGVGFLLGGVTDEYLQYALSRGWTDPFTVAMGWLTNWVFLFLVAPVPLILLLFPSGTVPSPRWRPVVVVIAALSGLILVATILSPGMIDFEAPPGIAPPVNPTGVTALKEVTAVVRWVGGFGLLGLGFLSVLALVLRYRRSTGEERQQMRWFVAAVALAALLLLAAITSGIGVAEEQSSALNDILFIAFFAVLGIGLPGACAVAVLRYRLYDLDVVVKKTVLYATVAVVLVAAFLTFAVLVGVRVIEADPIAIVASVAAGLAFWPAVKLARRVADRLVYGRRATPYEVLSEFSHRVGGSYASEDVLPRMAAILAGAVGATRAVVWLRVGGVVRPSGIAPADAPEPDPVALRGDELPGIPSDAVIEVRDQGELLGALAVDMPANDPMNPSKERLVRDLASQAGLVLRNVRLIEELRASRQRLVTAQDEERRKLERNIHDGAQQRLVALTVKLRLLEQLAEKDPPKARAMAAQIQTDATEALDDLRDLARGIYPPLLADKGLPAALSAQARKSAVPVDIDAEGIDRYPQDVEAAIYFCCLEALQNVGKYAGASRVSIALARRDGVLSFSVTDDGVGFDPAATHHGTGLQGIADRLDALGGTVVITSVAGSGTTVSGTVPVEVGSG
jgi:signal transduction histidine kinase